MDNIIQECSKRKAFVALLLKYPKREFTIRELSQLSKTPYATSWRFAQNAEKSGILLCRKIGSSWACKLNAESPLIPEAKRAILAELSSHRIVLRDFIKKASKLKGVEKIILFGSVSKMEETWESDIDVAVIVNRKTTMLEKNILTTADSVSKAARIAVLPAILTPKELKAENQFSSEVRKGELVYGRHKRG